MWSGDFTSWQVASQGSQGYSSDEILEKVKNSVLKVKHGEAVYERDSVLFKKIEYSWPLLASLMWVAAKNNSSLKVLDFGGSLGSSYFQNRKFLDELRYVEWNVVEQESFVATGRDCIEDQTLQFFYSIDECISKKGKPDILILACTLPYIEKPYELISELMNYNIPHIIIDNTPFNSINKNRICQQKVPSYIYEATLPCWLLSYAEVKSVFKKKYYMITEHQNDSSMYVDGYKINYKGFLGMLKQ